MKQSRFLMSTVVFVLTLALVSAALAQDAGGSNGSRNGVPDKTPPIQYLSPLSFSQGFDDITDLPNWYMQNNSEPAGIIDWFQGNDSVFPAHAGAPTAYIAANYNSTSNVGTISNWLLTPVMTLSNGKVFTFWTRTATGSTYPDRLEVRLSLADKSTNVGTGSGDVGVFTTLLLTINPTLQVGGYPEVWTPYSLTLSNIPVGSTGRFAFRYYVTDGGPSGSNSNYIGIDTVEYSGSVAPPEQLQIVPMSLHAQQPPNRTTVQRLQVCNVGGQNLDWSVVEAQASHDEKILLIATADLSESLERALIDLGYPYSYYYGDDWTGLDFSPFDIVIVGMDGGFVDQPSILKVRTDVIDQGKRLIFFGGTALENFVVNVNQYLVQNITTDYIWQIPAVPHFTVTTPTNPLAAGLTTPYTFANSSAAYYMIKVSDAQVHTAAVNGDGRPALFYKNTNFSTLAGNNPEMIGTFIWFINSPYSTYWANPTDFAFLKQVVSNSISSSFALNTGDLNIGADATAQGMPPVDQTNPTMTQPSNANTTSFFIAPLGKAVINSTQSDMAVPFEGTITQVGEGLRGSAGVSGFGNPDNILYDNGPLVTHPGVCSGMDASRLQTGIAMNTYGFGHQVTEGNRMADDFTITGPYPWHVDQIDFFAYQTSAPNNLSPITGVYYQIWNGPPNVPGSVVVFGDLTTNRLLSSTPINLQRDSDSGTCTNLRYIYIDAARADVTLPPGTYWIDWMTDGDIAYSGPWAPPITILGQTTTGNALQYTAGAWGPALDSGTVTQQGMPFVIEGNVFVANVPWLSENPTSGTVAPGTCTEMNVTFNSAGLVFGSEHFAALNFSSSDPDGPLFAVPVSLKVANFQFFIPLAQRK